MTEAHQELPLKILMLAQEEARSLGDGRLGTEHILLALLSIDNAACCALNGFGITYNDVRTELEELRCKQNALAVDADIDMSERALKCLELSYLEASGLKHESVAAEHLLLAILRLGQGVAIGILAKFGVCIADLQIALLYQCSSALAAPQQDVGAELVTQIEVWKQLLAIATECGYRELVTEAERHSKMYREALSELENSVVADSAASQRSKSTL